MITIRREQLEALGAPFAAQFVDQAVRQIAAQFPEQYAALGERAVRAGVVHGIDRAEQHGFSSDGEVLAYLAMTFLFGHDFDSGLPWAEAVLQQRGSPAERLARLQSEALLHEAEGAGYRSSLAKDAGHG
jgi:hypothetical protein